MTTPIFIYFRLESKDTELIGVKPANAAARKLLPDETIVSKALARWDFNDAELRLLANALPAAPKAGFIPEDLTLNQSATDMVQAILADAQVHRAKDKVSFLIDSYHGKLAVRYCRTGRIDIVAMRADIERDLRPGLTCIANYQQLEVDTRNFATPPAPLDADLATLEASFWNKVNPTFPDPFVREATEPYMKDEDILFTAGSEQGLRETVELLCYSWIAQRLQAGGHSPGSELSVYYHAQPNEKTGPDEKTGPVEKSGFWVDGMRRVLGMSDPLLKALKIVGQEHTFLGSSVSYNDDSCCRQSGYTRHPADIRIRIAWGGLTAHEQIGYHGEKFDAAVAWLKTRAFTDEDIAKIFLLPPPKKTAGSAKDGKLA